MLKIGCGFSKYHFKSSSKQSQTIWCVDFQFHYYLMNYVMKKMIISLHHTSGVTFSKHIYKESYFDREIINLTWLYINQ
jgi:hypothetical protein